MNNITTKNLAVAAIVAAILVVGGTFAATVTQSAAAYDHKKGGGIKENSKNGNTITIQKCKQAAIQSGFDNNQGQECENLICTHPGENATCVQEGTATPAPIKLTCAQCFTKFLTSGQLALFIGRLDDFPHTLETICSFAFTENEFRIALEGVNPTVQDELKACLLKAGIVFL
jgi:hypothetical protein